MFEKPNEEWTLFVILTQDMNKRMQYLVEGIAKDIIAYLMEDNGCDLSTALREFYLFPQRLLFPVVREA